VLLNLITDHPTGASPLAKDRGSSTYELSSYFRVFKSGFSSKLRFDKNDGGVGALARMTRGEMCFVVDQNDGVGGLVKPNNRILKYVEFIFLSIFLFYFYIASVIKYIIVELILESFLS